MPEVCPTCHGPAEEGCIYGSDRSPLRWRPGPPSFKDNLATGVGSGEWVGDRTLGAGSHVSALRCRECRLYFVPYDPASQDPDSQGLEQ